MGALQAKPEWVDSKEEGLFQCPECFYSTDREEHLRKHAEAYHPEDPSYILYMTCDGSIEGRNELNERVSAQWIDCTGGQAAYEDGDLYELGEELVEASREIGVGVYHVYRMYDPGLGLEFPMWWVHGGIKAGVFEEYKLPEDVIPSSDDEDPIDLGYAADESDETDETDESSD